jgi:SlyX protein
MPHSPPRADLSLESKKLTTNDLSQRLIDLEFTVAHLEHELQQMHSVLLAVQAELKTSREHVSKLERRMLLVIESPEERDPVDERPPHY